MTFNRSLNKLVSAVALSSLAATAVAAEAEAGKDAKDMSDPMAIYTSGGISYGTNGLNLKVMKTLDTGSATKLSAVIVEAKDMDFADDGDVRHGTERSSGVSNLRLRLFNVDMTTGRGLSYDIIQNLDNTGDQARNVNPNSKALNKMGMASVGMMQALPKIGFWQTYPIIGAGLWYGEDVEKGIDTSGVSLNFTMYNKFTVTDKIWLNWNLTYVHGIYGSDSFKDNMNSADDSLGHEFIASYQIDPRNNLRLWYNASHKQFNDDNTGETRLEFNHQF